MGLEAYLFVSLLLFLLGLTMAAARRSLIYVLIGLELILNAANLNLVAFQRFHPGGGLDGQIGAVFVIILAAAEAALARYISEQRRLGRDIRRSALHAALHVEGVQRVELTTPASDVVLDVTEAAHCTGTSVIIGGSDE